MVQLTVKLKTHLTDISRRARTSPLRVGLILLALLTFIFSLLPIPNNLVEHWYSRGMFPKVSAFFTPISDLSPVAWLDILLAAAIIYSGISIRRRRWLPFATVTAAGYLVFFWGWGLSYHRIPLAERLALNQENTTSTAIAALGRRAATEINELYGDPLRQSFDDAKIASESAARVALVVEKLDGVRWLAPHRVKTSLLVGPWFRVAGIDGMFNPIIHEAIINGNALDFERPFVISHELAHVRGYPNEGDANFVALMATLMSSNPQLRYSGWLHLWLYLRSSDLDSLLDPGPRRDVQLTFERFRRDQVPLISNLQTAVLNLFLRVNSVQEGIRSYSRLVILASGTQETWQQFR